MGNGGGKGERHLQWEKNAIMFCGVFLENHQLGSLKWWINQIGRTWVTGENLIKSSFIIMLLRNIESQLIQKQKEIHVARVYEAKGNL